MSQLLLIPDPRPLDKRLGQRFFLHAPKRPGVYLMRDAADRVLYIGKAKNLQQRLRNYRIANPDKMPRRHLRMVREVARIEFQFCHNETAPFVKAQLQSGRGLAGENKILRLATCGRTVGAGRNGSAGNGLATPWASGRQCASSAWDTGSSVVAGHESKPCVY